MKANIAYAARTADRPAYFANDHARDTVVIDAQLMPLTNGREAQPRLDREGFALVAHKSAVADFMDAGSRYREEIAALVAEVSGAGSVVISAPGVLRFAEGSALSGALNNSRPARFVHVDVSDATAKAFAERSQPAGNRIVRFAHYNIWRTFTDPPQNVPLALCDARSVSAQDLIAADAIFDEPAKPEWSFEGLVVAHNPAHRWHWFPDMTRNEAIIFKKNDSDHQAAHCVPHVAFDAPDCPPGTPPRASIEMRAIAYWHG